MAAPFQTQLSEEPSQNDHHAFTALGTRFQSGRDLASATHPDWSREACSTWWQPSRRLLGALRDYSRAKRSGGLIGWLQSKVAVARHRFWSVASGADVPLNSYELGGGLRLPHPNGVVIHPHAQLGPNCLLFQQVTIGTGPLPGLPRIGGHVEIGAGAKILGGVTIGDNAVIGANAVVLSDVPAGAVAIGVPAVSKRYPVLDADQGAAPANVARRRIRFP